MGNSVKQANQPALRPDTDEKNNQDAAFEPKQKRGFRGKLLFVLAAAVITLTVPFIFATAANTNESTKLAEIELQAAADAAAAESAASSPTISAELVSDFTETAATPTPIPTPIPKPTPVPTPTPTPEPEYTLLSEGMDDPFVADIQQRLMDLDYMGRDEPTEHYGPITAQAIEYFQRKNSINMDGIASVETQELLFAADAKYYTVSEGASGPDVELIQGRLEELGYSVGTTGYFGSETTAAVLYFQQMNDIADDGNVGSQTKEILFATDAVPSEDYVPAASDDTEDTGSEDTGSDDTSSDDTSTDDTSTDTGSGDSETPAPTPTPAPAPVPAADPGSVEAFVSAALAQIGKTYVLGGKGPDVFDCSGLVYYALNASGNGVGYMTSGGWASSGYAQIGSMDALQRGDVICYRGHVGIYLGDGTMVDASSSQGMVRTTSIWGSYWTTNFICGRRPF